MRLIWIVVMSLGYVASRYTFNRSTRKWIQSLSVPWVGVLSYRETKVSPEAIAGITLIKTKLGLANAYDVANIPNINIRYTNDPKKTTKAMFLTLEGVVQYGTVTGYVIHPEYNEHTLNTIALVNLEYDESKFNWVLMDWPRKDERMIQYIRNVLALGYRDDHGALEQVMYKMEYVNKMECDSFYKNEQLDSRWMAPTEYQCFRKKFSSEQCVFESGMVLAAFSTRKWKLLGISVLGPGCALPSRFINFARYVSWVQLHTGATRQDVHESKDVWLNYNL